MLILVRALRKINANFASLYDLWLFIRILFVLTCLPILMRFLSVPKLLQLLSPTRATQQERGFDSVICDKVTKYTDFILRRSIWIYRPNCLRRSLVLYHFLRQYGVDVQICFGVRFVRSTRTNSLHPSLEGHAWLLYRGQPIQERDQEALARYTVTYQYPNRANCHASRA